MTNVHESARRFRNLVVILGDQLNLDSAAWDSFDPQQDIVWMAEVAEESTHVWTHKARIAMFLACMRHFHQTLVRRKLPVHYRKLDDPNNRMTMQLKNLDRKSSSELQVIKKQAKQLRKLLASSS